MVNVFRKHQGILMPVFAVFIVIAFVWFYNGSQRGGSGGASPASNTALVLYGDNYSTADIQRIQRVIQYDPQGQHGGLAQNVGLDGLLETSLSDHSQDNDPNARASNQIIDFLVIKHEADALQIRATDDDVKDYVQQMPVFQTDGHFDAMRYKIITQKALGPFGFTPDDLLDTVRDELRVEKLLAIVGSTVATSPSEVKALYTQEFQKTDAAVVRLSLANSETGVHISDEEAAKAYAQRKDSIKSEEQRRVKFVRFDLSDADQKLTGKERIDALQKLANRANDFTVAMTNAGADFDKTAAQFGAKVEETGDFTVSHPDSAIAADPKLLTAAFNLKTEQPNSDAVSTASGFTVLHLVNVVPSKLLTFEEAKPQLVALLKREHAQQQLAAQAADIRKKIEASLTAKKSFADAAQAAGQNAETIPPFSIAEHDADADIPDANAILGKAIAMQPGELSEFLPTADGGLFIYVANREPIDEAKFEKAAPALTQILERRKQLLTFGEWLRQQRLAANPKIVQQSE